MCSVGRATARRIKDMKAERDRQIAEMWLACYTEEEIAESVGVTRQTVNSMMAEPQKTATWQKLAIFSEYRDPDWRPPLYDVWKVQHKSRHDHSDCDHKANGRAYSSASEMSSTLTMRSPGSHSKKSQSRSRVSRSSRRAWLAAIALMLFLFMPVRSLSVRYDKRSPVLTSYCAISTFRLNLIVIWFPFLCSVAILSIP